MKRVVAEDCVNAGQLPAQGAAAAVRQRWLRIQKRLQLGALIMQLIGGIIRKTSEEKGFEVIVLGTVVLASLVGSA